MDEELLQGGVGNAGAVVRVGEHVLRPSNTNSEAIHALLRHARAKGFDGVPEPVGIDADGRERLVYIPGDVPYPPFPAWSLADALLASTVRLLRGYHDAVADFVPPPGAVWSEEMADEDGGSIICHNDVCPENVVSLNGVAIALLDFDFAAPGRPLYDLAQLALMCVPVDTDENAAKFGRSGFDPFTRLRLVADSYGLPPDRSELLGVVAENIARGGKFVEQRVARGEQAFIDMWNQMGGRARYDRRREWFAQHRQRFADALG